MQCGTTLHLRAASVRAILARKAACVVRVVGVARRSRGSDAMNQLATLVPFGLAFSVAGANSIA